MSYILSALKKAESERNRDGAGQLEQLVSGEWDPYAKPQSKQTIVWWLLGASLVTGIMIAGLWRVAERAPETTWQDDMLVEPGPVQSAIQPANEPAADSEIVAPPPEPISVDVPEFQISGHIFVAQGSPMNRVFTDKGSFQAGDWLADGWRIERVEDDGFAIIREGRSEFVSYR